MSKFAWVTLTTNDTYSLGALVLAHSLKRVGTVHQLAVLVTPTVSEAMRSRLREVYNVVQEVNVLDSHDAANLALLSRPELGVTFTKLHAWRLTQFEKCVFLDADILVLQNADELFEREELSAAPDVSWPDCFNSGVFVYRPNEDTFASLIDFAIKNGSFDGGDQGLLNLYFSDWATKDISKHLSFTYNTAAFASYSYLPAFKQFKDKIKILHFAGKFKPWLSNFNSETKQAHVPSEFQHAADLVQLWWTIFCDNVHQNLSDQMAGLAGALSQIRLGEPRSSEQEAYEASMRRQCWEAGNIDYSGRDSFDNIWKKISQTLESKPASSKPADDIPIIISTPQIEQQNELTPKRLTSDQIEDGKIEYDPVTKIRKQYKHIEGGYEVISTIPQENGTIKTQVQTFYDPKPVTEEEYLKQQQEKKNRTKKSTKEVVRIDKNTTMITRDIPGGYEEVYTTVNDDGSKSIRTKTFYDAVEEEITDENTKVLQQAPKKKTTKLNRTNTEEEETNVKKTNQLVQRNTRQVDDDDSYNVKRESTVEETRRVTKKTEISGKKTTVRKDSLQEENIKAITTIKDKKKKSKKAPPPPSDFEQNDSTTVVAKNVPGGIEYTYTTTLENGKNISTSKTIYEEEEIELTEEEIKQYKKQLKEAEKHKNVTTTKKLKSESGTKKIVPSENPGDVTTVETIKIEGGTEYHYTTVTSEGIVKKAVKTVYDPVPVKNNPDDTDEEEIIEEYEEEVIEPGDKIIKTFETTKTLPQRFDEIVEINTPKKKSSKLTRTDTEEEESRLVQKKKNETLAINQQSSNVRKVQQEEHKSDRQTIRRESKVEETRSVTQSIKISGSKF